MTAAGGVIVSPADAVLMETVLLFLQIHVVSAFTLFALIPFSRLAHIFSVPVTYALRPFQRFIGGGKPDLRTLSAGV